MSSFFTSLLTIALIYGGFLAFLYFMQARLIFPGAYFYPAAPQQSDAIYLNSAPKLEGWQVAGNDHTSPVVVIYFAGNGDEASALRPLLTQFSASFIYCFNYRGYGNSEGVPDERGMLADAVRIYDDVKTRHPKARIVAVGHSMGSAVAGFLATKRPLDGVVFLAPLASIGKILREHFFGLVPVALLKHRFDLAATAPKIKQRTLAIVADQDRTIPPAHSLRTFDRLAGEKQLVRVIGASHNTLFAYPQTMQAINTFLQNY